MLEAACDKARAVVLDPLFFDRLPALQPFTALLDASPGPNPGLDRLLAVKAHWCADTA